MYCQQWLTYLTLGQCQGENDRAENWTRHIQYAQIEPATEKAMTSDQEMEWDDMPPMEDEPEDEPGDEPDKTEDEVNQMTMSFNKQVKFTQ